MTRPFIEKAYPVYDLAEDDLGKQPLSLADPKPYAIIARGVVARYYGNPYMPYACIDVKRDSCVPDLFKQTRELGIKFTTYAYMLQGKMEQQIDEYVGYMKECGLIIGGKWQGELPPVADIELEANIIVTDKSVRNHKNFIKPLGSVEWSNQCKQWLDAVESETGVKPMIYTAKYILDTLGNPSWSGNGYPFWMKYYPFEYYIDKIVSFPASQVPKGVDAKNVVLWQYFDQGRKVGFNYSDMNTMTTSGVEKFDGAIVPTNEPPIEIVTTGNKYRVDTAVLNIRPDPSTARPRLGKLYYGDVVEEVECNNDGWVKVKRNDGLVGWSSLTYLKLVEQIVTEPEPEMDEEESGLGESEVLFDGAAIYKRVTIPSPYPQFSSKTVTYHVMQIDVDRIEFVLDSRVAVASTTHFLEKSGADIAINGDGYHTVKKWGRYVTQMANFNAYKGVGYGPKPSESQSLYISRDNEFSLKKPKTIYNAIGVFNLLVVDGKVVPINKSKDDIRARTALGITKDQKTLFLLVVDGKDYWIKEGLNFEDTAKVLVSLGCDLGLMFDGGGSTTLVMHQNGKAKILNVPSGENKDGQRSVANHVGIKIKK